MSLIWLERDELQRAVESHLAPCDVMLDIGCGIRPHPFPTPIVHICAEPYAEYQEALLARFRSEEDRLHIVMGVRWDEVVDVFPAASVDTVVLADVIEHLEKPEALALLPRTLALARRQVAIFTPWGFMPQSHPDGVDAWNMQGGAWQEHRSGWLPEDFIGPGWQFFACRHFHSSNATGEKLETPHGAFWAVHTNPPASTARPKLDSLREIAGLISRNSVDFARLITDASLSIERVKNSRLGAQARKLRTTLGRLR